MTGESLSEEVTLRLNSKWSQEADMKRCVEKYSRQRIQPTYNRIQPWDGKVSVTTAWSAKIREQWGEADGNQIKSTLLNIVRSSSCKFHRVMIPLMKDRIYVFPWIVNAKSMILSDPITIVYSLPLCGFQYSQGLSAIGISSPLVVLFHLWAPLLKHNVQINHFLQGKI